MSIYIYNFEIFFEKYFEGCRESDKMQLPVDKETLWVFLRDYGGRSRKGRKEKIQIVKDILATGKATLNGDEYDLTLPEKRNLETLYRQYVLGKWTSEITKDHILGVFEKDIENENYTIRDISTTLSCSDEIIRRKLEELVFEGVVIRGSNPKNKRQGLFCLKSKCVVAA